MNILREFICHLSKKNRNGWAHKNWSNLLKTMQIFAWTLKIPDYIFKSGFVTTLVWTFCNPVEKDRKTNSSPPLTVTFLHLFHPCGMGVPGKRTTWTSKKQKSGKDGRKLTHPEVCLNTSWIPFWTLTRLFVDTGFSISSSTSDSISKLHFSTAESLPSKITRETFSTSSSNNHSENKG